MFGPEDENASILSLALALIEESIGLTLDYANGGRDITKMQKLYVTRGLNGLSLDLPNIDKMLLSALRNGSLDPSGPLSRTIGSTKVPVFLQGLWRRIITCDGRLLDSPDPHAIFLLRSISLAFKRYGGVCSKEAVEHAISEYRTIDSECRNPSYNWGSDAFESTIPLLNQVSFTDISENEQPLFGDPGSLDSELLNSLQQTCDFYCDLLDLNSLTADQLSGRCNHGPGSVANMPYLSDKFCYQGLIERRHLKYHNALNVSFDVRCVPVQTSKLIVVPKDRSKPRLIASEPVVNQYLQQGLASLFLERMQSTVLRYNVDLSDQSLSRDLARLGSIDGKCSTIDLSNASDRLSCWTVERVFRRAPQFLTLLNDTRTPLIRVGEDVLPLKKFASQGSATNFPIQTFVYLMAAITAVRVSNGDGKYTRCYGDDIIVDTEASESLVHILSLLGLKVNNSKSFTQGHFRESCGGDYYRGYDVTPVKISTLGLESPESRASVLASRNLFYQKGLWRATQMIDGLLDSSKIELPIVGPDSGSQGYFCFQGSSQKSLKRRWNSLLHRVEVFVNVVKDSVRRTLRDPDGILREHCSIRNRKDHWSLSDNGFRRSSSILTDGKKWVRSDKESLRSLKP